MSNHPLITPTHSGDDKKRVDAIFAQAEKHLGFVPEGLRLYSISPTLLESFFGVVGYFMAHETFRPELTAMIRYLSSSKAGCKFCIDFNEAMLVNLGADLDNVRAAREDLDKAPLEEKEIALVKLALDASDDPESIAKQDIEALKAYGWSEKEIFEATFIAANNRSFTTMLRTFNIEQQGAYG
jgi:alkylhydroperoxidase family enzyme